MNTIPDNERLEDLLSLGRVGSCDLRAEPVDLGDLARDSLAALRAGAPEREVDIVIGEGLHVTGDRGLLRLVMQNLLENAWKFTSRCAHPRIQVDATLLNGEPGFLVVGYFGFPQA